MATVAKLKAVIEADAAQAIKALGQTSNAFKEAADSAKNAEKVLNDAQKTRIGQLQELEKIELDKLNSRMRGWEDEAKRHKRLQDEATQTKQRFQELAGQRFDSLVSGMQRVGLGTIVAAGLAVKSAVDWESAFAGVRKTIDATPQEFDQLANAIRQMSREIPVSARELAGLAETAGQLGIPKAQLMDFVRTVADVGVSSNLSADAAANAFAKIGNIMGVAQGDYRRLGSTVIALGNSSAATEADIVAMTMRLAGAGKTIGMTIPQVLGIASTLASVGLEAEAGGSAFSKVFADMGKAVAMGGNGLSAFAAVAGRSAGEFAAVFKKDAAQAVTEFVEGLGKIQKSGGNVFSVLDQLGLSEIRVRDALLRTANAGGMLRQSLDQSTDAWGKNNALTKEAEQRYATTASQQQIVLNSLNDVAIDIGNVLLPTLKKLADGLKSLTTWWQGLSDGARSALSVAAGLVGSGLLVVGFLSKQVKGVLALRTAYLEMRAAAVAANGVQAAGGVGAVAAAGGIGAAAMLGTTVAAGAGALAWMAVDQQNVKNEASAAADSARMREQNLKLLQSYIGALKQAVDRGGSELAALKKKYGGDSLFQEALGSVPIQNLMNGKSGGSAAPAAVRNNLNPQAPPNPEADMKKGQAMMEQMNLLRTLPSVIQANRAQLQALQAKLMDVDQPARALAQTIRDQREKVRDLTAEMRRHITEALQQMGRENQQLEGRVKETNLSLFFQEKQLAGLRKAMQDAGKTQGQSSDAYKQAELDVVRLENQIRDARFSVDDWNKKLAENRTAMQNSSALGRDYQQKIDGLNASISENVKRLQLLRAVTIPTEAANLRKQIVDLSLSLGENESKLVGAIKTIGTTRQAWDNAAKAIQAASPQYIDRMRSLGLAMSEGTAKGIKQGAPAIMDAVQAVVAQAIAQAKGGLQIKSPSKVFALMGSQSMEGFADGVKAATNLATGAVRSAVGGIVSAPPSPPAPSGGQRQAAPNHTVNHFNVTVQGDQFHNGGSNDPMGLSPEQRARMKGEQMMRALMRS